MSTTIFDAIQKKSLLAARFPNMGKKYDNISPGLRGFEVDRYTVLYYPKVGGIDIVRIEVGEI